jgi:hypothetical protein
VAAGRADTTSISLSAKINNWYMKQEITQGTNTTTVMLYNEGYLILQGNCIASEMGNNYFGKIRKWLNSLSSRFRFQGHMLVSSPQQ